MNAKKITLMGMMLSLMLILGLMERLFVLVPQAPAIKPGLSNIVLMYALCTLNASSALWLLLLKVLLSGLMFAGVSGMMYAFCGGIMAYLAMVLLYKTRAFGLPGISVAGAVMHMLGQILCSRFLLGSWAAAAQLPLLLFSAVVTGVFNGTVTSLVIRALQKTKLPFPKGKAHKEEQNK